MTKYASIIRAKNAYNKETKKEKKGRVSYHLVLCHWLKAANSLTAYTIHLLLTSDLVIAVYKSLHLLLISSEFYLMVINV